MSVPQELRQPASVGRIVQYRLPDRHKAEEHKGSERKDEGVWRAAIVVNAFAPNEKNLANLQIFLDAANDKSPELFDQLASRGVRIYWPSAHAPSVAEGLEPGCWRWPPRVA